MSLPWVDQAQMHANVVTKQVQFSVTDPTQYNEEQLRDAFRRQHFNDIQVLAKS